MIEKQESILIVDNKQAIRKLLLEKLSIEGYQCREASNAEQALDKLGRTGADLVFLATKMPETPGTELLPEIKSRYPDTAVIMVTATTDINTAIQCVKQGASSSEYAWSAL